MVTKPAKVGRVGAPCLLNEGSNPRFCRQIVDNCRQFVDKKPIFAPAGCFCKKVFAPRADQSC